MKKNLIYFLVFGATIISYIAKPFNAWSTTEEEKVREAIVLTQNKSGDPIITRSLIEQENVSAVLDRQIDAIEINLAGINGNVYMFISKLGQNVSSYQCNATLETQVYLPMPQTTGEYCLTIITNGAEYEGYFLCK
ncbi:MAG: hypothetical protein IKV77_00245 [Alistipes sp.]|nr:hypothetical protein [Alistipes sp.]